MGLLSDLVQAIIELLEKEVRSARREAVKVVTLIILGYGFLLIGLALLI